MKILITGGAGYIGSHTCLELLQEGFELVVVDNLSNSSKESLIRVNELTDKYLDFYEADIRDKDAMRQIFSENDIAAVIHFAGLKAVGESVSLPLRYYQNNIAGTLVLCEVMQEFGVKQLVFSSSATVYGDPETVPVREDFPTSATNPYGRSKLMIEEILKDLYVSDPTWNITLLRYFNPVGAHKSGRIGEDPNGLPNNLMPFISQVAVGKLEKLGVFGNDYNTVDGTGVRDYIHVVDLAKGHLQALVKLAGKQGVFTYNIGTGTGYSVLQMIKAFEEASGKKVPYQITDRRPGDIATCFADSTAANRELDWKAEYGLEDMCRDSWNWQSKNPHGYK